MTATGSVSAAAPVGPNRCGEDLRAVVARHEQELVALRRHLHAHPELSGREERTTEEIAERLRVAGLDPVVLAAGTGVVCDIDLRPAGERSPGTVPLPTADLGGADEGGADVPTVALRADIDALAMSDEKAVPYRSRVPGAAHACGHDVHTVMVLGAGLALAAVRDAAPMAGRVRLVFEPAEETVPGGAVDVLDEGWLRGVSQIYGLHCDPKIDVGTLGVRTGALTAASDAFEVRLFGPGGHTARPHLTVDLVGVLAALVTRLPAAMERRAAPFGRVQMVFGAVHAGDAPNVIPATGLARGSLRTPDRAVWERTRELLDASLAEVLGPTGARWGLEHTPGVPPVINDPAATAVIADVGRAVLGPEGVVGTPRSMGGDSFAWYLEAVPGSYARIGTHDPAAGGARLDLHSATFDVDERVIGLGVRILTCTALAALGATG